MVVNPRIVETSGEWAYEEGCLSVPGLSWEIVRPNEVHLVGRDLDGNEIDVQTDEFEGRIFQHEVDHLNGFLLIDRLDDDQRKAAKRALRKMQITRVAARSRRLTPTAGRLDASGLPRYPRGGRALPRSARGRAGHDVVLVITQPDRRRGRGSEVSRLAGEGGRPGAGAARGHDSLGALSDVDVERGVVVGLRRADSRPRSSSARRCSTSTSRCCRAGAARRRWNARSWPGTWRPVSASSRWSATLDTGPLHARTPYRRSATRRRVELTAELAQMGAELLVEVLASPELLDHPRPQVGESTYAAKLTPETFHLTPDLSVAQARRVVRLERAFIKVERATTEGTGRYAE